MLKTIIISLLMCAPILSQSILLMGDEATSAPAAPDGYYFMITSEGDQMFTSETDTMYNIEASLDFENFYRKDNYYENTILNNRSLIVALYERKRTMELRL